MTVLKKIIVYILLIPLYLYKWFISPLTGPSCRHVPSCSKYTIEALKVHGPFRGFCLATNRISRCRPGGTHGYDPVPKIWIKRYRPWMTYRGKWPRVNRLKR
ncbi:MAG: membrane protein insertion efficiency factor YidD [Bacteroidota bacterium]